MEKLKWLLATVGSLTLLGGCVGMEVSDARRLEPKGSEFNMALYAGYLELSEAEFAEGDYIDSDRFAIRAKASASDKMVWPEEISLRKLPTDRTGDLSSARRRLALALASGARTKAPGEAAHAQVMFDCWMQEQEENFQPDDISACRGAFETALVQVEDTLKPKEVAAAPEPALEARALREKIRGFLVFFEFASDKIGANGQQVIDSIAAAAEELGSPRILISAHADRAGAVPYNQALSELRASVVAKALAARGVPNVNIELQSFGETRPFVPTADGVPEPQNRIVFVTFEK